MNITVTINGTVLKGTSDRGVHFSADKDKKVVVFEVAPEGEQFMDQCSESLVTYRTMTATIPELDVNEATIDVGWMSSNKFQIVFI